ncbi:contractile injection system sheath initiator [Methanobrevibacter olleyae]|uniref:Phage-related protein n=1 Tax=Methanobrevibacter olleyae TaxID=294671 RepID=A0A126R1Q4_METOL|nr:DUF2634 domain-containing protein [Methanobrevibacter olleyae]AMK16330.1 phage-related protein [Methanobrevibacter olleyae]
MEADDKIFGCDYSSTGQVSETGDILLVCGIDNAIQSIINQILTEKGFYPSIDTEYGSEIYESLGEDIEELNLDALKVYLTNALLENERVAGINRLDVLVTVTKTINVILEVLFVNGTEETMSFEII